MAYFKDAFNKTLVNEGGYSNHPADRGGETYKGIARERHPGWPGWAIVDELKTRFHEKELEKKLNDNTGIREKVEAFYKAKFWDIVQGDQITNQEIAEKIFDLSVNIGTKKAVEYLQKSLNLLNRNRGDYPDIDADGNFGPQTLDTITMFLEVEGGDPSYLLKILGVFQGVHYIKIMEQYPSQEIFARGWLNRIEPGGLK